MFRVLLFERETHDPLSRPTPTGRRELLRPNHFPVSPVTHYQGFHNVYPMPGLGAQRA
jgi:hypothetical protein